MKLCSLLLLIASLFICIGCNCVDGSTSKSSSAVQSQQYAAQGYVRSVWTTGCTLHNSYDEHPVSVVALEGENRVLFTVWFNSIEPRLWQGMHAKIQYHEVQNDSACKESGYWPVKLDSVEQVQ